MSGLIAQALAGVSQGHLAPVCPEPDGEPPNGENKPTAFATRSEPGILRAAREGFYGTTRINS